MYLFAAVSPWSWVWAVPAFVAVLAVAVSVTGLGFKWACRLSGVEVPPFKSAVNIVWSVHGLIALIQAVAKYALRGRTAEALIGPSIRGYEWLLVALYIACVLLFSAFGYARMLGVSFPKGIYVAFWFNALALAFVGGAFAVLMVAAVGAESMGYPVFSSMAAR